MPKHCQVDAPHSELLDWIDAFLIDRKVGNAAHNTIRYYRDCLTKFAAFCHSQGVFTPENVDARLFRQFILWLEAEGHNQGGRHAHYRICRTFFYWWGLETSTRAPFEIFKRIKISSPDDTPLPPVPLPNVLAMVKTCGKDWLGVRDKAVILALLDTGARAHEFLMIDFKHVNLMTGTVYLEVTKNGKPRSVYLGRDARRAVRRYLGTRKAGPLWLTQDSDRLSYQALRKILTKRSELANVEYFTPHAYRRACCVSLLRSGVDLETIRRILGHSNLKTIVRYLALIDDDLQRAHAHASPADQLRNLTKRR